MYSVFIALVARLPRSSDLDQLVARRALRPEQGRWSRVLGQNSSLLAFDKTEVDFRAESGLLDGVHDAVGIWFGLFEQTFHFGIIRISQRRQVRRMED